MNAGLAVKRGILYLYGGMFEDNHKQLTLNDFYGLGEKKIKFLLVWLGRNIIEFKTRVDSTIYGDRTPQA